MSINQCPSNQPTRRCRRRCRRRSTAGGNVLSALIQKPTISVGASSAICALMGAFLVDLGVHWRDINPTERRASLVQALAWLAVTVLMSAIPFVDAGAHLGGFVVGLLLGCALFVNPRWPPPRQLAASVAGGVALLAFCEKRAARATRAVVSALTHSADLSTFLSLFLAFDVGPPLSQAQINYCG